MAQYLISDLLHLGTWIIGFPPESLLSAVSGDVFGSILFPSPFLHWLEERLLRKNFRNLFAYSFWKFWFSVKMRFQRWWEYSVDVIPDRAIFILDNIAS